MNYLKIQNISKHYGGIHALRNVSINCSAGEIIGLIGPNGSGKTTLLNCLAGTTRPDSGSAMYESQIISERAQNAYRAGVVRTFQAPRLFPQLTVMENLLLVTDPRTLHNSLLPRKEKTVVEAEITKLLKAFNLESKKNELVQNLSYGQKKLIEIAKILASEKNIILLDEPFAGLYSEMIYAVQQILLNLKTQGKTIIIVEHNPRIITELCDTVIVLDAGLIIASGKSQQVFNLPVVRKAYLGK